MKKLKLKFKKFINKLWNKVTYQYRRVKYVEKFEISLRKMEEISNYNHIVTEYDFDSYAYKIEFYQKVARAYFQLIKPNFDKLKMKYHVYLYRLDMEKKVRKMTSKIDNYYGITNDNRKFYGKILAQSVELEKKVRI